MALAPITLNIPDGILGYQIPPAPANPPSAADLVKGANLKHRIMHENAISTTTPAPYADHIVDALIIYEADMASARRIMREAARAEQAGDGAAAPLGIHGLLLKMTNQLDDIKKRMADVERELTEVKDNLAKVQDDVAEAKGGIVEANAKLDDLKHNQA